MTLLQFDTYHSDRSDHAGRGVGPVVISVEEDPRGSNRRPVARGHRDLGAQGPGAQGAAGTSDWQRHRCIGAGRPGHIFALELGGPNVAENIVPQWAFFQEHGTWRQMEAAGRRRSALEHRVLSRRARLYGRRTPGPVPGPLQGPGSHDERRPGCGVRGCASDVLPARVVSHLEFNGKALDGTDGAAFSGNPNSWHTDTPEMFSAHMGKKKIATPWR
jgi:hypothetical protein